ncbi:unnamed protein product, partial [Scytosiphon promiscuus]
MVNVRRRRCSHNTCIKGPCYNVEGNKTAVYCKQHAEDGMVAVCSRRCTHDLCIRAPSWGALTHGTATVCSHHKSD